MLPETALADLPTLTAAQMADVDRIVLDEYLIALTQLMENAGRELARLACDRFLEGDAARRRVVVAAGAGGNGGGALVAARHLHNWGATVTVLLPQSEGAMKPVARRQLSILQHMGVPVRRGNDPEVPARPDVVLDGLVGFSLRGAPAGAVAGLIRWANDSGVPILALDVPSGLDATTGVARDPAIRASATLTLALPKIGLRLADAISHVGELYLADIGIPPAVYSRKEFGFEVAFLFARGAVIRLR